MRAGSGRLFAASVTITLLAGAGASAHRLDEYLQAARIDLRPDGVRVLLDLTPGATVAESIIAAIDRDRNGVTSSDEQRAYAREAVGALHVAVDASRLPVRLESFTFPSLPALRRGEGTIRLEARTSHPTLSKGQHELFFRNAHLAGRSVYLANALVPDSDRISVTGQRRDGDQRELTIDYSVGVESAAFFTGGWLMLGLVAAAASLLRQSWRLVPERIDPFRSLRLR